MRVKVANLLRKLGFRAFGGLSVDHRATLSGVGWTTLGQIAGLLVRFVSVLVIPQILIPADYGIFVIAISVLTVVEFLSDIGLRPAIVRHPQGERTDFIATAWLVMIGRGIGLAAITLACGFLLPQFYPDYDGNLLFWVIASLAIRPILHSFSNPMAMLLHRHMRFDRWSILEFSQTFIGACFSMACAYYFRNVWAIVIGTLAGELAFVAASYLLCKRPPMPAWHPLVAKELAHVGNQVFINTLVMALWLYVDRLVGAGFITVVQMGLYAIAWNLMDVVEKIGTKATDVYYSALTKIHDPEEQMRFHRSVCRKVALFVMPLLAVGIILAPWAIKILYKSDYRAAGVPFAILMCRAMFRILGQVQFQLLLARAEIYLATRCYLLAFVVQVAAVIPLAVHFGVVGVAYSVLISTFVLTLAQNLILSRRYKLGLESFLITYGYMAAGLLVVLYLHR
jgi:O-antigen/teichoic acid export membrane protein